MIWSINILTLARLLLRGGMAVVALQLTTAAEAVDFSLSGFGSLVGGRTYGPCVPGATIVPPYLGSCTRYIADWSHAGVYTSSWSIKPESKIGLQGTAVFSNDFSATAQVVGRLVQAGSADLEWGYLTYHASPVWTLQLGRMRLPLFFYSDFQDVGYAYTWVRPPPDVYGWEVVNYNGGSATYREVWGGWAVSSNFFAGGEVSRNNKVQSLFVSEPQDVKWTNIRGGNLELNKEWFTGKLTYIQSDYQIIDRGSGSAFVFPDGNSIGKQKIYGYSINVDTDKWLLNSEYSIFDRYNFYYKAIAWMVGVGYRMGPFTPMITMGDYQESTKFTADYSPLSWATRSFTLRYELSRSSALKFQFDKFHDRNYAAPFTGNANVVSMSYDIVF